MLLGNPPLPRLTWWFLAGALFCAQTFATGTALFAQNPEGKSPKEMPLVNSVYSGWKNRGASIEAAIRAGKFKNADSAAGSLLRDMTRKITGGPDAGRLLAMPLSLRALARVGLQRDSDALWDFQMAHALWPALERVRLSDYGPTGVRLAQIAEAAPLLPDDWTIAPGTEPTQPDEKITPPQAISKRDIDFPESLSRVMKSGQAVISLFIDREGRLNSPRINSGSAQNAVFLYSAMEGVRDWRFRPAMRSGEPVAVTYTLTVNYRLRG
ncbi:MAG: TonB family protein [Thermoanaerobaculia bacterium]